MHQQVGASQEHNDAVERVLRQAEMSRLTRNLKSKLALASMQAQHGPAASQTPPPAGAGTRKRAKTLEGASTAPRFMAAASEPARRPSQQKRYSLPSASPRGGAAAYRTTPSRSSSRPLSRTASATAIPPMPTLPTFFVGPGPAYAPHVSAAAAQNEANAHNQADAQHEADAQSRADAQRRAEAQSRADAASEASRAAQVAAGPEPRARPGLRAPDVRSADDDEALPAVPQTPPQRRRAAKSPRDNPQTPERRRDPEDGASLLLHFAHSPGHAATPRTPDFNMSDYLHFQTPSPARPARMGTPRRLNHWGSLSSLSSSNIFVPTQGSADSAAPTPVKTSTLLSPTQHPPMPSFPTGARIGLEKSPSDL